MIEHEDLTRFDLCIIHQYLLLIIGNFLQNVDPKLIRILATNQLTDYRFYAIFKKIAQKEIWDENDPRMVRLNHLYGSSIVNIYFGVGILDLDYNLTDNFKKVVAQSAIEAFFRTPK